MPCDPNTTVLHRLEDGYHITVIPGRPHTLFLRDRYCTKLAVLELFQDRIVRVSGYRVRELPRKHAEVLIDFVRGFHYFLSPEAALELGLSVIRFEDGGERYFTVSELSPYRLNKIMRSTQKKQITLSGWQKSQLTVPKRAVNCTLNLSRCKIKKLQVARRSNVAVDLRDNPHIETVTVEEGFIGSLNLSRSSVTQIRIGDNCRCNISMNYSGKCFDLEIGDVYSGVLDIRDSCFHNLKIGYYCYANIKLSENWGQKNIAVGDSFRGNMILDSVYVRNVSVGSDCRGKIFVKSSERSEQGIRSINLADDFGGELDVGDSKTVERVEVGRNASGNVNLSGCASIKALKLDEYFAGVADLSRSGIMYIRARKGATGRFVLTDCSNLTLVKVARNAAPLISIDRSPIEIARDEQNVYYRYLDRRLPDDFFTPAYMHWFKSVKNFFRHGVSH